MGVDGQHLGRQTGRPGPEDDWSGGGGSSKRLAPPGGMLGASVYELPPDGYSVYHFHHGSEELLIALKGRPTLRTPDGERQLDEGESVYFPPGPEGAHGLANGTSEPVRYLVAGTTPLSRRSSGIPQTSGSSTAQSGP